MIILRYQKTVQHAYYFFAFILAISALSRLFSSSFSAMRLSLFRISASLLDRSSCIFFWSYISSITSELLLSSCLFLFSFSMDLYFFFRFSSFLASSSSFYCNAVSWSCCYCRSSWTSSIFWDDWIDWSVGPRNMLFEICMSFSCFLYSLILTSGGWGFHLARATGDLASFWLLS